MPSRRPRLKPGASASYASPVPLETPTRFIATLRTEDGLAIQGAWISVHLSGPGFLSPEGAGAAQAFTFRRTDESGVVQFTWLPGTAAPPAPISLICSAASSGSLRIRAL